MGHKHNIQPLAVSGKQGLLLRDDVRIAHLCKFYIRIRNNITWIEVLLGKEILKKFYSY